MDFVIQWLWYLLAFVVGSALAWLITVMTVASESWCKSTGRFATSPSAYGLRNSGDRPAQLSADGVRDNGTRVSVHPSPGALAAHRTDTAGPRVFSRKGFGRTRSVH